MFLQADVAECFESGLRLFYHDRTDFYIRLNINIEYSYKQSWKSGEGDGLEIHWDFPA